MRKFYALLFTLLLALSAAAQQGDLAQPTSPKTNFFIGAGVSTITYNVKGKAKYGHLGVSPALLFHVGYQVNERASVQAGLGYGKEVFFMNSFRRYSSDSVYVAHKISFVRALVTPFTIKITPFDPHKKLQLYANTTLAPVLGRVKATSNEILKSEFKRLYDEQIHSFNLVATAGLTVNYRLNPRVDGFIDGELISVSLHEIKKPAFDNFIPVSIGINYRLK